MIIIVTHTTGHACAASSQSKVKAVVQITSIDKVDLAAGTYSIDFYLLFIYDDAPPKFEFINGAPIRIEKTVEREGYVEYRVKATFA